MFFGTVLKPGVECTPDCENGEILHLSQACLHNPTSNEKTYVQVSSNGKDFYALCCLQKDKQENASLDLFVSTRLGTTFKVSGGKNEIHLVGYFEPEAEDSESDECDHSDDEHDSCLENACLGSDDEEDQSDDDEVAASAGSSKNDSDDESEDFDQELSDDENESDNEEDPSSPISSASFSGDKKMATTIQDKQKSSNKVAEPSKKKTVITAPTAVVETGKKRKADSTADKPVKQQKVEASISGSSAEVEFEKSIIDYLKKNGRCMISQLAGKVRKPDSLKAIKYQAFLKGKSNFIMDGQYVSLKA